MSKMSAARAEFDWPQLISRHPLFKTLSPAEQKELLSDAVSRKHSLAAGEIILREGETGNSLHVIGKGSVAIVLEDPDGKEVPLYTLGDGEIFGEMALFGQRLRSATLVTAEPSEILEIDGGQFLTALKSHPEAALYLLAKLSERLRHTDEHIISRRMGSLDSSLADLSQRLEVVVQTTDAKLAAAQTMFDQTNSRAGEIIESQDRARTRFTWLASTATVLLGLLAGAGFWNFKDAQEQIGQTQEKIDQIKTEVDGKKDEVAELTKQTKSAAQTAGEASQLASNSATKAASAAKRAQDFEVQLADMRQRAEQSSQSIASLSRRMLETRSETERLLHETTLGLLTAQISDNIWSDRTVDYYIRGISAEEPDIRGRLVNFLHGEIISGQKLTALLSMFRQSLKRDGELKRDALVATYYFLALIAILENDPLQGALYESYIQSQSEGSVSYFTEIFGKGEFQPDLFIQIVTSPETVPDLQKRKQERLRKLYAALQHGQ